MLIDISAGHITSFRLYILSKHTTKRRCGLRLIWFNLPFSSRLCLGDLHLIFCICSAGHFTTAFTCRERRCCVILVTARARAGERATLQPAQQRRVQKQIPVKKSGLWVSLLQIITSWNIKKILIWSGNRSVCVPLIHSVVKIWIEQSSRCSFRSSQSCQRFT